MRTVAIIQARMGSTRLPGKILMGLAGEPMLVRVVNRTKRASTVDKVVVATTTLDMDNRVEDLCNERSWSFYRGSEEDLLDRYYQAANIFHADVIVRITSDCPLIDPHEIDRVVREFKTPPGVDYVANILPHRTFPRGLDTEVFGMELLNRLWHEDKDPRTREHVAAYLHQHPESFTTRGVLGSQDHSNLRWTVDTPEDFLLITKIYDHFGHDRFSYPDVLKLLNEHSDWNSINAHIQQKNV